MNCFKLGGQEKKKKKPLEISMYYNMEVREKGFIPHLTGLSYKIFFKKQSNNYFACSSTSWKENKWHISAIIHSQAKFPKYRNLAPTGIFPEGYIWKQAEELLL